MDTIIYFYASATQNCCMCIDSPLHPSLPNALLYNCSSSSTSPTLAFEVHHIWPSDSQIPLLEFVSVKQPEKGHGLVFPFISMADIQRVCVQCKKQSELGLSLLQRSLCTGTPKQESPELYTCVLSHE